MTDQPTQDGLPGLQFRGPYLGVAVLCEKVLHERDGVMSVIRMVDRVTLTSRGHTPAEMPRGILSFMLYLMFKSGDARGTFQIGVRSVNPSGQVISTASFPLLMEGEDRGAALVTQFALEAREEGVYWFDILLEEQVITRVPLRVVYQRIVTSPKPPES
jgi:hypothetical protein